jgi:hypothetical protein
MAKVKGEKTGRREDEKTGKSKVTNEKTGRREDEKTRFYVAGARGAAQLGILVFSSSRLPVFSLLTLPA